MTTKEKTKVQVQMNKSLAQDGKLILAELGLTPTNFITMAYTRLVAEKKIPFETKLTNDESERMSILLSAKKQKPIVLDTDEKIDKYLGDE